MNALFLSDVHLAADRPDVSDAFCNLMAGEARNADAVYLLGDVFDVWLGDDVSLPQYAREIEAIRQLSDSGTTVYCLYGNHDFTMGKRFANASGCFMLREPHSLKIGEHNVVILHGDSLCTDDIGYQRYRRITRSTIFRQIVLRLPVLTRQKIADKIRSTSNDAGARKLPSVTDVTTEAVIQCLQDNNATVLIHGHTHRPYVHTHEVNGVTATRYVLGDWYSGREYLQASPNGFSLRAAPAG